MSLFFTVFAVLVLAELTKGLSANGTPPVLQKLPWQMDLAYFMWTNILKIRIVLSVVLVVLAWQMSTEMVWSALPGVVVLGALWGGIYWIFNKVWIGKYKFLPLTDPAFATADANQIDLAEQVMGVERNGEKKAYPVSMIHYHHQLPDELDGLPIWVTYCGLCRSGRVYDRSINGQTLDLSVVGAITFNATHRDAQTGSWWRQETGECAKGPLQGKELSDIPMEQMSLGNWLEKHPDSQVLQRDPVFDKAYAFRVVLMNYEASVPGWHMQEVPAEIIGLEINGQARAYDWKELIKRRVVADEMAGTALLLLCSEDGSSPFVYRRSINDDVLEFEMSDEKLTDSKTQSTWNLFGQCIDGEMKGAQLESVQSYRQYIRAWASFHPNSSYFDYLS